MKRAIWVTVFSFVFSLMAAVALIVLPTYSAGYENRPRKTVIEVNGDSTIILLMFPVVVALAPVMFPARAIRIIAATLLCGFTAIGSFSIGLFYLPASLLMVIAASNARDTSGDVRPG
jgi:hypothetical protein